MGTTIKEITQDLSIIVARCIARASTSTDATRSSACEASEFLGTPDSVNTAVPVAPKGKLRPGSLTRD